VPDAMTGANLLAPPANARAPGERTA
jgi:hypothetical protein